jgi:hypothetical protein
LAVEHSDTSSLEDVRRGLGAILERIAGFFDIFDLSFFVSGATTLAALSFWTWKNGVPIPPNVPGWMQVMAFIIGCYVLGACPSSGGIFGTNLIPFEG